jgi:hypothetical protein
VAGGLGVAASVAASGATGALPPLPTVTATTPLVTATVALPTPPTVTATVELPPVTTVTATVAAPPPPPPVETVVSAVTGAVEPVATTAAGATQAAGDAVSSAPSSSPAAAPTGVGASPSPPGPNSTGVGAASGAAPTAAPPAAAPTLRARRTPGRLGARRLVLTLDRPRELTVLFRGPGETCRVAGRVVVDGRRGANVVPLNGRVRGGRLAPGRFRVEVLDTTGSGQRLLGRLAVALRYDAHGRARVRQVRYVPRDCALGVAALLTSSSRVSGERTGTPAPAARPAAPNPPSRPADAEPEKGGLAAIPNLSPGDAVGGLTAVILIGLFLLSAGAFLLVAGGSARRALRR